MRHSKDLISWVNSPCSFRHHFHQFVAPPFQLLSMDPTCHTMVSRVPILKEAITAADFAFTLMEGSGKPVIVAMNALELPEDEASSEQYARTVSRADLYVVNLIADAESPRLRQFLEKAATQRNLIETNVDHFDADDFAATFDLINQQVCTYGDGSFPGGGDTCASSSIEYLQPPCFIEQPISIHIVVDMSASVKQFMISN